MSVWNDKGSHEVKQGRQSVLSRLHQGQKVHLGLSGLRKQFDHPRMSAAGDVSIPMDSVHTCL